MENQQSNLNELYAKLTIEDEEEGGVIVGQADIAQIKESYVLIGRFLTEKSINFTAMQNVLASIWRPKEGVEIHDLGDMRYSFVFYHPLDVQKFVDGGPWSFEQGMLVFKQITGDEDPKMVLLNEADIWIQVYDIPKGFVSESILQSIANSIGCFVKSDPVNLNGLWKSYYRIRVRVDVSKPLKRRMKIKREGGEWSWVNFKYERLSTFCFVCGKLGHSERDCNVVYANAGKELERAYGTWLRAPNKNSRTGTGSRWLRNGDGSSNWEPTGDSSKSPAGGGETARNMAIIKEGGNSVAKNLEDNERIIITERNQGHKDMGGRNLNRTNPLGGNNGGNFVIDLKRRRTEEDTELEENGPITMQTDGLFELEKSGDTTVPKNLNVAGSVEQARLIL
ncbi:uncharacterized protein LOC141674572 [Apium graveolens]|uniref:uncharacterized protein LOC141674572 n=1 Tax=Apium graveolens TaxID=4045 RepID=UPI003D78C36F